MTYAEYETRARALMVAHGVDYDRWECGQQWDANGYAPEWWSLCSQQYVADCAALDAEYRKSLPAPTQNATAP